jgi:Cu(I)/Ag(I) efflux system membrane protein CusA/SilA
MINKLIRYCLENAFIVFVVTLILIGWGWYAVTNIPVDAIPDIGENQAIVFTDWPGRDPQTVEDQVTYPLTISLEGVPGVKVIRSFSGFGFSIIYVIFKDEIDFYWARSRVLERMNVAQQWLPEGVVPVLGPDATAMGQVFWYTVEGEGYDLGELRSIQDWYVRYQLNAVEGVSEVASVGGYVKQYQIDVDPNRMRAHGVKLSDVYMAVRRSNIDVGAKVVENYGMEYIIRGVGFVKTIQDVENIVVKATEGTPIFVKNVATVTLGPDFRRGALDKEGAEVVGGVVVMRYGENPLAVIKRVKEKIKEIEPGLPEGVKIVPFYDRTGLIHETIDMLKAALSEEMLITVVVIVLFLLHLRSSLIVSSTLPLAVLMAFIAMYYLKIDSNVMSLAGIAIAIGTLVDMGVIMTENIYRHLTEADGSKSRLEVVYDAAVEVGSAILTAVSTTIISFIPVFTMESQEGKLFKPLAWTKTFCLFASIIVALTLVPVLCNLFLKEVKLKKRTSLGLTALLGVSFFLLLRSLLAKYFTPPIWGMPVWLVALLGGIGLAVVSYIMTQEHLMPLEDNRVSRFILHVYEPVLSWILQHKLLFISLPLAITIFGFSIWLGFDTAFSPLRIGFDKIGLPIHRTRPWVYLKHKLPGIGREFMPALDEGSFLYMPSLLPAASLTQVMEVLKKQDILMKQIPEVDLVVGKLGRAESALDPAPVGMIETVVSLKPKDQWRMIPIKRWYSDLWLPKFVKRFLGLFWPEKRRITKNEILEELRKNTDITGVAPTWLQPIQTRVVMLQSGLRAMMGAKIFGDDLKKIERVGLELEQIIKQVPGAVDVLADRIVGKPYIEFNINRQAVARYGVRLQDVQDVIETAIGGMNLTWTVEGRERYPVRVRYLRELRDNFEALPKILVPTPSGAQIPISQVVDIKYVIGPATIKSENALLVGYVTFNTRERDEVSVVEDAQRLVAAKIKSGEFKLPKGYYIKWAGQFENQIRANKRLALLLPICLFVIFFILYLQFKDLPLTLVLFFSLPVSLAGGFMLLEAFGYNLSVAVWVGFIALFGIASDNGVVTATYLDQTFAARRIASIEDIREATIIAGKNRIRPCLMTTFTTVLALIPVLTSTGRGSDVMKPMAIPSVGGMTVALITLFIVPCCYAWLKEFKWRFGIKDRYFDVDPPKRRAE